MEREWNGKEWSKNGRIVESSSPQIQTKGEEKELISKSTDH